MRAIEPGARLGLRNVLFLTDFSEPSEITIPYAMAIAREYEAKLYALHALTPVPLAHTTPESATATIETSKKVRKRRCSDSIHSSPAWLTRR